MVMTAMTFWGLAIGLQYKRTTQTFTKTLAVSWRTREQAQSQHEQTNITQ